MPGPLMRRRSATPGLAQRCVDLRHRSAHPGCPTATTTCAGCSTTRTSRRVTLKGAERPQRVSLPAKPPLGSEPMYTHTRRQRVLTVPEAVLRWSRSVAVPPAAEERAPHKGRVEVLRLHMPQTGFSQTAVTVSLGGARSNRPSGPFLSRARRLRFARIMGTSVAQIDATYGHLVPDSDDYLRGLLDTFDANSGETGEADALLASPREGRVNRPEQPCRVTARSQATVQGSGRQTTSCDLAVAKPGVATGGP